MKHHLNDWQRKALLVLPLILVFFTTILFVAFGGGQPQQAPTTQKGLNTSLPGAAFDQHEKPKNKMSFYDEAKLDSARTASDSRNPLIQPPAGEPTVDQINQKLAVINRQISQPQPVAPAAVAAPVDRQLTEQVNRLEGLMKTLKSDGPDPEMQQLGQMLSQIQQIQNPKSVVAKADSADSPFRAVSATIDGKQKIKQQAAVRLRLNDTLIIRGQVIPKGTLVFGTGNISQQRLLVSIKNIRLGQAIIPVDLVVYALDGMPGVPAPEAELGEAAADGATGALQNMQFMSMDQSLAAQAATSGINAARSLFSKKVKRIIVHLKDGEQVLLRNNQPIEHAYRRQPRRACRNSK